MASPSTVITLGYGSFGSASLLPTIGYGIPELDISVIPFDVEFEHVRSSGAEYQSVRSGGLEFVQVQGQDPKFTRI